MKNSCAGTVLIVVVSLLASACSPRQVSFDEMIPEGATRISYAGQSGTSNGLSFQMTTDPNSYKYVDVLRGRLHSSGYRLCKKSAISKWEKQPTDARHHAAPGFWIVELYADERYESFVVLRVVALPSEDGRTWSQSFSLADQAVPSGRQDMASIKNFCD